MLTVGDKLPSLTVPVQQGTSALPAGETIDLGNTDGKWKILFYWPKDFTFVCPTEIVGYGELKGDFADRDAVRARGAVLLDGGEHDRVVGVLEDDAHLAADGAGVLAGVEPLHQHLTHEPGAPRWLSGACGLP